jgi:hypothetical protein
VKKISITFFLVLLVWGQSFCQVKYSQEDLFLVRRQLVIENYNSNPVANLLNGKDYTIKHLHAINSQLFNDLNPTRGSLIYDGILLDDIELQYDLFNQEVIVLLESNQISRYVSIDEQKISSFSFSSYEFIYLEQDGDLNKGIYQIAFSGKKSTLLIKRSKKFTTTTHSDALIKYIPVNKYYVKNDYGVFNILNKKSLIEAFDESEELITVLKKSKIKFSKKKIENGLMLVLSAYDKDNGASK